MTANLSNVSQLLSLVQQGEPNATERLTRMVYPRLKQMARRQMHGERSNHTLQATALVNEAYLELFESGQRNFSNRAQFFAYAAAVMRHILVRHARAKSAAKRGGKHVQITLSEAIAAIQSDVDLISLDAVLTDLTDMDPRKGRLVELRFFGGLTIEEIAEVEGLSTSSVNKDLRAARGWIFHQIQGE
ncbi:MAG: ECF-type sigma factor [Lysobacterales bacterium]